MKRGGWKSWLALGLAFLMVGGLVVDNLVLRTTEYEVVLADLPEAFEKVRIVQLSDLHNAEFGRDQQRLLAALEAASPDLVVMTGDLVSSGDTDPSVSFRFMEEVARRYETLFSLGNHDQYRIWMEKDGEGGLVARLSERGVRVLDNTSFVWERDGEALVFTGYTAPLYERPEWPSDETEAETDPGEADGTEGTDGAAGLVLPDAAPLFHALGKPLGNVDILLAHDPEKFPLYVAWGADLVLSGHLHGGVIRIPGIGGLLSPAREWFPEYDAGWFSLGNTQMVVNRGLGQSVIPIRIFNPPELVVVTLTAAGG